MGMSELGICYIQSVISPSLRSSCVKKESPGESFSEDSHFLQARILSQEYAVARPNARELQRTVIIIKKWAQVLPNATEEDR